MALSTYDEYAIYGITPVDLVSWGFFILVSSALLFWVLRNTFPAQIIRDSLNKEKRLLHEKYRQLKLSSENLYYQATWAKNDGRKEEAENLLEELKKINAECKEIARMIGRKHR